MLLRRASPESEIASSKTGIYFCTDPYLAMVGDMVRERAEQPRAVEMLAGRLLCRPWD